jgi:hypothetical protein
MACANSGRFRYGKSDTLAMTRPPFMTGESAQGESWVETQSMIPTRAHQFSMNSWPRFALRPRL